MFSQLANRNLSNIFQKRGAIECIPRRASVAQDEPKLVVRGVVSEPCDYHVEKIGMWAILGQSSPIPLLHFSSKRGQPKILNNFNDLRQGISLGNDVRFGQNPIRSFSSEVRLLIDSGKFIKLGKSSNVNDRKDLKQLIPSGSDVRLGHLVISSSLSAVSWLISGKVVKLGKSRILSFPKDLSQLIPLRSELRWRPLEIWSSSIEVRLLISGKVIKLELKVLKS